MPTNDSTYAAHNKLIYTWNKAEQIDVTYLQSYSDSLIFDSCRRVIWYKGKQYGNSYYGSAWGETFNDFLNNKATGTYSHAEGTLTSAMGDYSHAEGEGTWAEGQSSHAEGYETNAQNIASHAEGYATRATGKASHAEGNSAKAEADSSHAEGNYTSAKSTASHAEGSGSIANGQASHAEGYETKTNETGAHSEGRWTLASNIASHAEGTKTNANGIGSHSEGYGSYAIGDHSHAEGYRTYSTGYYANAKGRMTYAIGSYSNTSGIGTVAYNAGETAIGSYNISYEGKSIFTVGNGTSYTNRSNAINVTKKATYINNAAYFTDNINGNISNTYVDCTYLDAYNKIINMNAIVFGLLGKEKYIKPNPFGTFTTDGQECGILVPANIFDNVYHEHVETISYSTYMEVGSYFHVGLKVFWPTWGVDEAGGESMTYASRSEGVRNYMTDDQETFGYSYGVLGNNGIEYEYFHDSTWSAEGDYEYCRGNNLAYTETEIITAPGFTYIFGEPSDEQYYKMVASSVSISYLESSYCPYESLRDAGYLYFSYNDWFNKGVVTIPIDYRVYPRYAIYMGLYNGNKTSFFSNIFTGSDNAAGAVERKTKILNLIDSGYATSDWLQISGYKTFKYNCSDRDILTKSLLFWFAVPSILGIEVYSHLDGGKYTIEITDGENVWDLQTPCQKLTTITSTTAMTKNLCGGSFNTNSDYLIPYRFYGLDFKGTPIGDFKNIQISLRLKRTR